MVNPSSIRELTVKDLVAITLIHLAAFPNSALTKLGSEAVRRYYEWQIIGPHDGFNIGAFVESELAGFCFGGIRRGALGGFLEHNRAYLIRRVVTHPWLLSNQLFRERAQYAVRWLLGTLRLKPTISVPHPKVPVGQDVRSFGILSIAVDPKFQGQGIAQVLMEYSEHEARNRGFTRMHLTVHPSNVRAVRFYEKMGWQRDIIGGTWSGSMSRMLQPTSFSTDTLS